MNIAHTERLCNLPFRVLNYEPMGTTVWARGESLLDGSELLAALEEQEGQKASAVDFKSLAMGAGGRSLVQGGVVLLERALRAGTEVRAASLRVLAWNSQEADKKVGVLEHGLLQPGPTRPGQAALLYDFQANRQVNGRPHQVAELCGPLAEDLHDAAFLIRVLNKEGRVAAYELMNKSYRRDGERTVQLTVAERAVHAGFIARKLAERIPETETVSVVPAARLPVLCGGRTRDAVKRAMQAYNLLIGHRDYEYFCAKTVVVHGPLDHAVSFASPVWPGRRGMDPVLLGSLSYSPALRERFTQGRQPPLTAQEFGPGQASLSGMTPGGG